MCSRTQFTDLTYMGGTGPCGPMAIIFRSIIQSQYTSLNIKFGVNRTFHVLKTPVYLFDLYGRYRTLFTDDDNFWQCYSELVYKPKYQIWCEADVPYAQDPSYRLELYGGTGPCAPMMTIFGSVIQSQHTSINIKFGGNRTFHVLKTAVYRFDLYGKYQTLWTDDDNLWQCYLELAYKHKY